MNGNANSIVDRIRKGRGFSYRFRSSGRTLVNAETRAWIQSLAIPPAWMRVEIDLRDRAKVHATGIDSKGRKQYIYDERWRASRERAKFDHILEFADRLPAMRRITALHLRKGGSRRERVLACMVRLLDNAYFRPGSRVYTQENHTYGLTTLRSKHLTIEGDTLIFDYVGKSGRKQHRQVTDGQLTEIVRQADELPGYEIFKYRNRDGKIVRIDSDQLNEYIQEIMAGEFTAKDFRTWGGTYLAATLLDQLGICDDQRLIDKNVLTVIDQVASTLGNTRSIARSSYIDPRLIHRYESGRILSHFIDEVRKEIARKRYVTAEERALLCLLREN